MQTKMQLLQEAARRGIVPKNPKMKALYDEALKRGIITPKSIEEPTEQPDLNIPEIRPTEGSLGTGTSPILEAMRKARAMEDVKSALTPDEPVSDIPAEYQELGKETAEGPGGFLKTGAISTGRGLYKIGRAIGIADPETEAEKLAFQALEKERPITTAVGGAIGETLPFLPFGVGAATLKGPIKRFAAEVGLGFIEGGAIAKGEGRKFGSQLMSAGIGGTIAGAMELGIPVVGFIGSKIVRKVTGKKPTGPLLTKIGQPTPELQKALDSAGLTFEDMTDASIQILKDQPRLVDPNQAARKAFLEGQGLTDSAAPTTAQVTRGATEFQAQQEAAKTTGEVGARLEAQQGVLTNRFDETIAGTGGQPVTSGSPIADHVLNRSTELDNEIYGLYEVARERLTDTEQVDLSKTFARLKSMEPSDSVMGHPIKAIQGEAKRLGLIDADGKILRKATVEESELLRKFSNQLFNSVTDHGRTGLRNFRNAIDDDVTKSAGEDIFKQGRQAKAKFEADLSRSKISKFDKRKRSIIRDILENKDNVNPEDFLNKTVLSKTVRATDIRDIKNYLNTGTPEQVIAGKQAFDDLRAETLEWIKNTSFIGPEDANGVRNLSRDKLTKAIDKIGKEKLDVMFSKAEVSFLNDMVKVSKLLEPVRGTFQGKGPSAQAVSAGIESLKRRMDKLPALNLFIDIDLSKAGGVLKGKPAMKKRQLLPTKRELAKQTAITGTVAETVREKEE